MTFKILTHPSIWARYSRRVQQKIAQARNARDLAEASSRGRMVVGEAGSGASYLQLRMIVDENDGQVVEAAYQLLGPTALVAAAEAAVELIVGKPYLFGQALTSGALERHLRDVASKEAIPYELHPYLNLACLAVQDALKGCSDLQVPDRVSPLLDQELQESLEGAQGLIDWDSRSHQERMVAVEAVLQEKVRPYVAQDGGGVHLVTIVETYKVQIIYSGACESCLSSTGATLASIQSILRAHLDPRLSVDPTFKES